VPLLLGQQVGFRDHPGQLIVGIDDRQRADPVLGPWLLP
jgi:hypothetical protein